MLVEIHNQYARVCLAKSEHFSFELFTYGMKYWPELYLADSLF